ncbi:MAG TPA: glycosyltransferase family 2 protein [Aeromicrobium sp.]|nr:glycosyltransferase family 2 protein [Aeromicrobium sp.]HKY57419.1 glycosyltransferase family 2 protein [Aeromicrobium sp.]
MSDEQGGLVGPDWPEFELSDDETPPEEHHWLDNPPTVAAVIVAHNGARWLPKVLGSFSSMFYAPTAWRAVDVGSTDGSSDLLRDAFGAERISFAPSGTGFGEAAWMGVEQLPRTDWIWLLHDDVAVLPGTLAGLLDVATSADDIAVVGPKLREWPSLKRLLEVGVTITNTGTRETGLETGEPDAGQHDWPRDVLAVSSAGMLVRRDVWDELDGFDPALPMFCDDIDFGWRVARAGYRTRTAPSAVAFHAEATWRGTRRRTAGDVPQWEARRAALYTLLANASRRRFLRQYVRLFVGSLLRFFGFLLGKDPESASDELLALRSVYAHPLELREARQSRAGTARRDVADFRHLFPPFWLPYRHGLDAVVEATIAMVKPESIESTGRRSSFDDGTPLDQLPEEQPSFVFRHPWLITLLALFVLALVAGRGLFSGPDASAVLHGGALPMPPDSAGDWWRTIVERSHPVGLLSTSIPPVFLVPLALAATPFWASPGIVVSTLMLFAVPLAALTAHRLGRRLTSHRTHRKVWAVSYALSIVAVGAVAEGRLGTVVALIVLPIVVNTAIQIADDPGWQKGVRLGIWIAVASAFAPISFLLCVLGLGLFVFLERKWVLRDAVIALVTSAALLGPWLAQRVVHPTRMWWEAGFPIEAHASVLELLFGRGGGPGAAPIWFNVALPVVAALAIVPRRTRHDVLLCWVIALVGLAVAVLGNAMAFTTPFGPAHIAAWVGVPLVIWVAGLLTAVMLAVPEVMGLPRAALATLTVAVLLVPVGLGGWWLVRGTDQPLVNSVPDTVPAYIAANEGATLVITGTVEKGADARVVAGAGPFLGLEAASPTRARAHELQTTVARLLARPALDDVERLSDLGISAIYAPAVDSGIARRIDGAPGLRPAGSDSPQSRVWVLPGEPAELSGEAPRWRWLVGGSMIAAWLVAIMLTAPVRRRRALPTLGDEGDDL